MITVKVSERSNEECGPETAVRCAVGDLTMKHDRLTVAGRASEASQTQRFFTDANLPLSGPHSVVGRSLVLLDDASPVARGNRLACTPSVSFLFSLKILFHSRATSGDSLVEEYFVL